LIFSLNKKQSTHWRCTLAEAVLEAVDLWFWYWQEMPVLKGVDLSVLHGEFVALIGANGSGKTTLVKHFNGLLRPRRGQMSIASVDTAHRSVGELSRRVGYLFQHPEQQIFSGTVRQEVAFGPHNLGLPPTEVESRVEEALARFDLSTVSEKPPAILSYGLRRRVTLASLMAMDPPILVLDEPTVGLDAPGCRETFDWLSELHDQGRTIVLVTHDMTLVAEHAERVVVLHEGRIIADEPPIAIFQQRELLAQASLAPPPVVSAAQGLWSYGLTGDILTVEAFCTEYITLAESRARDRCGSPDQDADKLGLSEDTSPQKQTDSPNRQADSLDRHIDSHDKKEAKR
jgi:energy-coupling factor transport system ATP-binding protein